MESAQSPKPATGKRILIAVAIFLVISIFIPANQWDSKITRGRYVSEAVITQVSSDSIVARISGSSTTLTLKGRIPDYARQGQLIQIGYSPRELADERHHLIRESVLFQCRNYLIGPVYIHIFHRKSKLIQ